MKPFSILRLSKPMTAAALAIALIGCNKQDTAQTEQQNAELANQRAELEAEKQKVALEKEEALKLRDESERLRAEAELRSAITKLTDQVEKAAATEATPTEPIAKSAPDSSAENAASPVANTDQEVDLPPLPDLAPLPPVTKDVSYQPFYDELSDKGEWMDSTDYGYVWQPPVGNSDDWAPYTDGGWSYTDAGWAWDSNESFGHVCYHYGRWVRLRGIGWVWVPGRDWAPAWVSWRSSDDCIGWAPLPPRARWTSGVGIHSWVDGVYHIAPSCYTFVTIQNICHRRCRDVIIPRNECEHRYLHTRNVTNITEYKYDLHRTIVRCEGPAIDLVRKHLGSGLRENKIAFTDFKHAGAISANETKLPGVLTMPQWQLAKGIAQNDKPKLVQKKLPPTLDVIHEPAKENRLAVRKLMAQEAKESLMKLPSKTKPTPATIATAPKRELNQTVRPGTSLPPVGSPGANPGTTGPRKQEEIREIAGTPTKPGKLKTEELHQSGKPIVSGNDRPLPPVQTRLNPVKPAHQGNPAENPIASSSEPKREQETGPTKAPSVAGNDVPKPQGDNNSGDRRPTPGVKVVPDPANPTLPYPRDELHVAKNPSAEEMRKQQADRNKAIQEKLQQDAEDQSKRLHGQQGPTKLPPIVQNPPANQQQGPTKLPPIVQNPPVNQQQGPTKLPPVIMPPNQNGGGGNQNPAADTAAIRQKQAEEQSRKQEQEWAQRRAQAEQAQMSQKAEQAREAQRQQAQQNQQQQASVMRQRQENQQKQENDRQTALEAQRRQQDSADKQAANRMREQQIAQQQEAAARQRQAEQGRNQQAEDNRRQQQAMQAREQQEENNRRQQQVENARQQQAEMARRQEENSRREAQQAQREAAQRQQENAQRRAADEAHQRQQQQQQQENSRRQADESNRRAQADAAERRQQEESSRRQQDESKNKKGR